MHILIYFLCQEAVGVLEAFPTFTFSFETDRQPNVRASSPADPKHQGRAVISLGGTRSILDPNQIKRQMEFTSDDRLPASIPGRRVLERVSTRATLRKALIFRPIPGPERNMTHIGHCYGHKGHGPWKIG